MQQLSPQSCFEHFHHSPKFPWGYLQSASSPTTRQLLICFNSLQICLYWTFHINGIIQFITFCVYLLSFSIMFLSFLHVVACISVVFHYMEMPQCVYIFSSRWTIWVVSNLGQLWIMWTLPCKSLYLCFHFFWINT